MACKSGDEVVPLSSCHDAFGGAVAGWAGVWVVAAVRPWHRSVDWNMTDGQLRSNKYGEEVSGRLWWLGSTDYLVDVELQHTTNIIT